MMLTTQPIAEFEYKLELTSVSLCACSNMLMGDLYLYKIFNMQIKLRKTKKVICLVPCETLFLNFNTLPVVTGIWHEAFCDVGLYSKMQISNKELREPICYPPDLSCTEPDTQNSKFCPRSVFICSLWF